MEKLQPMTDARLQELTRRVLEVALEDRSSPFVIAVYHEGEALFRMRKLEKIISRELGVDWLNFGEKKDAAFEMIKLAVRQLPPDALFIATQGNGFAPTEAFRRLPVAAQEALLKSNHDAHHRAAAAGLFRIDDVMQAIGQTPERVCWAIRPRVGGNEISGGVCSQREFQGRMKMFEDGQNAK